MCYGLTAVGCTGERGASRPASSVRDGAGILIAESVAPALPDTDAWRLPTFPTSLDDEGYLWVGNYLRPMETDRRFSVFDPDGRWLTVVDVPDDIDVFEVGADYVLARWTDELDVEYVRVYGLSRPRARP
jgi:hypothetical protein